MNSLINTLTKLGLLKDDLDYHLVRASMVIIFLFFGYQKWFEYEAQTLIPYISNGPLIFWLYPVFGIRGASWFLGFRNGYFARSCSRDSRIKNWGFLEPSVRLPHSSEPSLSFHSCLMAGLRLPAGSRR
jgi:hypothetical protein